MLKWQYTRDSQRIRDLVVDGVLCVFALCTFALLRFIQASPTIAHAMLKRLIAPLAIVLIAIIAAIGYQLGQNTPATDLSNVAALPLTQLPTVRDARSPLPSVPMQETPLVLPTQVPPAPTSDEPLPPLVFARQGQIWRSDGNGAPLYQLTTFDQSRTPSHPSISPDGSQIAFVALIAPPITATLPLPTSRLYTMHLDGSDLNEIWAPQEGILWLPSWAPDSTTLYLFANGTQNARGDGDTERLQVVRIDLASYERTTIITGALDPTVARDGTHLAYLKFADDGITMRLEVADLNGNNPQILLDGRAFQGFYAPRFSPDGQQIYVAAIGGPETDNQGFPLPTPTSQDSFEWLAHILESPHASAHGAPWDIWRVNLDGTGLRKLTKLNEDLPMVACSPDGQQIAIMAYGGIYLMNPDGSAIRRIDPLGDHGGLDWVR